MGFGQGKVMQQVGCITIFLCSMVVTCESNGNGRFSTQLGLAKPSLEGKSKMLFFSERQNYFEEKKHSLFVFLLRAVTICVTLCGNTAELECGLTSHVVLPVSMWSMYGRH